jgi:sterol desaturase/sphingolipid hydroxylase (fatty acid hydroxylase superfamily)
MSWTGLYVGWWLALALQSVALFVVTTLVFDCTHFALHRLRDSRWRLLRRLGGLHQAHHDFCDSGLVYHDSEVMANLVKHVLPEYATEMAVCALGFAILHPVSVGAVMLVFTVIVFRVLLQRGKDGHHWATQALAPAHGTMLVQATYHALHHVYPDSYFGSYTTLFDRLMGSACQVRGRRFAMTGASGAFGSALKELLERAGAEVTPLKHGVDYTEVDYSGTDTALVGAEVLVLAHGSMSGDAMQANCCSFLALIERFKEQTRHRLIRGEVWAVGSEIECHPTLRVPRLQAYARSKRAYAREAARLFFDKDVLYRHIVPSSFRSRMGPGLMSGRTAAWGVLWLIRRGFRYVPLTYTGIAFLNFIPFFARALVARWELRRVRQFVPGVFIPIPSTNKGSFPRTLTQRTPATLRRGCLRRRVFSRTGRGASIPRSKV